MKNKYKEMEGVVSKCYTLNIHKDARLNSQIIYTIYKGTRVKINSIYNNAYGEWYLIETIPSGITGFVLKHFIEEV